MGVNLSLWAAQVFFFSPCFFHRRLCFFFYLREQLISLAFASFSGFGMRIFSHFTQADKGAAHRMEEGATSFPPYPSAVLFALSNPTLLQWGEALSPRMNPYV